MAALNDTARTILSAAAAREGHRVVPLPELRAPAHIVKKMLARMIIDGLLAEVTALPEDTAWTESEAGGRVALVVTPTGLAAVGVEPEAAPATASPDKPAKGRGGGVTRTDSVKPAARGSTGGGGAKQSKQSKQDVVLALLRRPEGASVQEMTAATGWQPHSVRGFMSGALKKRLGLEVVSEKDETGERRYHVAAPRQNDSKA